MNDISTQSDSQPNNPLHGKTLKDIVETLVSEYGWAELGRQFNFKCFLIDPTIPSCLKFLRKTGWARKKIELFYIEHLGLNDSRVGK